MDAFEIGDLVERCQRSDNAYLEFLRVSSLSAGVYMLPAGSLDPQQPHASDEVYYIVQGRAQIKVRDEDRPVGPGAVVYVKAGDEHRFHSIAEDLTILVFFAPAE